MNEIEGNNKDLVNAEIEDLISSLKELKSKLNHSLANVGEDGYSMGEKLSLLQHKCKTEGLSFSEMLKEIIISKSYSYNLINFYKDCLVNPEHKNLPVKQILRGIKSTIKKKCPPLDTVSLSGDNLIKGKKQTEFKVKAVLLTNDKKQPVTEQNKPSIATDNAQIEELSRQNTTKEKIIIDLKLKNEQLIKQTRQLTNKVDLLEKENNAVNIKCNRLEQENKKNVALCDNWVDIIKKVGVKYPETAPYIQELYQNF